MLFVVWYTEEPTNLENHIWSSKPGATLHITDENYFFQNLMLWSHPEFKKEKKKHKQRNSWWNALVLVLAGTEFIFFLVVGMVPCFGPSVRIMLITHLQFGCCWAVLTLSQGLSSVSCSASEQVHKKLVGSTARTWDFNWPKGYYTP